MPALVLVGGDAAGHHEAHDELGRDVAEHPEEHEVHRPGRGHGPASVQCGRHGRVDSRREASAARSTPGPGRATKRTVARADRSVLLDDVGDALGSTRELSAAIPRMLDVLVPAFAQAGAVGLMATGAPTRWFSAHDDGGLAARLDASGAARRCVEERRPTRGPAPPGEDGQLLVVPLRERDGERGALAFSARAFDDEDEACARAMAALLDVARAHARLREDEVEARGRLAAAAGALRSPLEALRLCASYARVRAAPVGDRHALPHRTLQALDALARRVDRGVQDVLDEIARAEGALSLSDDVVDVAALVEAEVVVARSLRGWREVAIDVVAGHRPLVRCDRDRLARAVASLVDDAAASAPRGTRVVVRVDAVEDAARVVVAGAPSWTPPLMPSGASTAEGPGRAVLRLPIARPPPD